MPGWPSSSSRFVLQPHTSGLTRSWTGAGPRRARPQVEEDLDLQATRWTWRTPATASPTWRMTAASSAPPSRFEVRGCAHICLLRSCGQQRPDVRRPVPGVVARAGRECGVQGNRPTGVWGSGGWTGGTDPEGALGLQGFQRWGVAKGGSSVEPAGLSPAGGHVREGGAGGM